MLHGRTLLGVLFSGGAFLCGLLTLCSAFRSAGRVEGLAPITRFSALAEAAAGSQVLIEGRLSSDNPVRLTAYGFVAYLRQKRTVVDSEGTPSPGAWSVRERVTPPLAIELDGGIIEITNQDYDLENGKAVEEGFSTFDRYSDTRYVGVERGDEVIAVGVLTAPGPQPEMRADLVARGTQASYTESQRAAGVIFFLVSLLVAAIGGLLLGGGEVLGRAYRALRGGGLRSAKQPIKGPRQHS